MRLSPYLLAVSTAASLATAAACAQSPASPVTQETASAATAPAEAQGGTIAGTVTSATAPDGNGKAPAGVPLPGVTITATNTLTGRKYAAATDITGSFKLLIPKNGRYVVRAEFAAFAPSTSEVLLNAAQHSGTAAFKLELASRVAARNAATQGTGTAVGALLGGNTEALTRGLQSLRASSGGDSDTELASAGGGAEGSALPGNAGLGAADSSGTDSVAISGQAGRSNGLAGFNEDEVRERIQDAIANAQRSGGAQADIANAVVSMVGGMMAGGPGGFGGPGGGFGGPGGRGGGGGRGNFRNFNPSQIHGNVFYQAGNSALDATQFSVTGLATKPGYSTNRYGLSLTGSPYIPGLTKPSTKQNVFLNLTGGRNINPFNTQGTVPTLAQRLGNFNGLTAPVNGVTTPVTIYNPATGQTYGDCSNPANATCNVISAGQISPQAQALLAYIPVPNVASTGSTGGENQYNYQRITTIGNNNTQLSFRYQRSLGASAGQGGGFGGGRFGGGGGGGARGSASRQQQTKTLRQNVSANFTYSHSASDIRGLLPSLDGKTSSSGSNLSATYSASYGRLSNNLSAIWNYSHGMTRNAFTYGTTDPASAAGITIPRPASAQPGLYNGVPDLQFTNFASVNETNPSDRLGSTISLSDVVSWRHGKHNFRFGFDGRRVHNDQIAGTNGIGQFVFTGLNTQRPSTGTSTTQSNTGNSFADFLLGAPQTSTIQAGTNKIYLRQWVYDGYVQDDYRLLPNVTLNTGLRYEYFSPLVEKYNRLVNLDHDSSFLNYAQVLPSGRGAYSGAAYPRSLINPDRTLLSPRIGVAWRPKFVKNTVVRAGYGINFNTGQYSNFANSLSYQAPFATTQNNVSSQQGCGAFLTGFTLANAFTCNKAGILSNTFAVNRDYRLGLVQVMNLDIQHQLPMGIVMNVGYNNALGGNLDLRRSPNRTLAGTAGNTNNIIYEDSIGESRFHALSVNLRKRLQKGIGLGATYQYGHSIDDASSVNGSGNNTVPQNDQRIDLEFGNSTFDVRHKLTGNFVTELPFGPGRAFLKTGRISRALDDIFFSGDFNFATGSYATPQYQNSVAQAAAGNNYTLRPDRVFSQAIAGAGTLRNWFNKAAFAAPGGDYGTASRNSIRLPGIVAFDLSLSKSVDLGELKNFEARITASNVLNTVQYSGVNTVLNSSNFGQVTGAAAPRKLQLVARYRF